MQLPFDSEQAIDRLMRFLAVPGITGQEAEIGAAVAQHLRAGGVPEDAIRFDDVHKKIPLPTQSGNLIVTLSGTRPGPRRMFMTHLDTVPLCAGAVPVRNGKRIVPQGRTALGGDNRTGCACLATTLLTLLAKNLPHPPLTFLFTVREESGLWGARFVEPRDLGHPEMCFNVDGGSARSITIGAVGADRWEVEIHGKASHAGVRPENGISATLVASIALAEVHRGGWFGKIVKKQGQGTSNVGPFGDADGRAAGQATNVVTDYVKIHGESRSHDARFVSAITKAYKSAFQKAATQVINDKGKKAKVKFVARRDYYPFRLKETSPVVRVAKEAMTKLGWEGAYRTTNGGLDANWLTRNGIPTITFGAGQNNVHTIEEYVDLEQYIDGCLLGVTLATME